MTRPPLWFMTLAVVALLWNLAGLAAVVSGLRLTAAEMAALPAGEQALHDAMPLWSVGASLVAVLGGTLGCVGLLLRKRWALAWLYASLAALVVQDIGMFVVADATRIVGIAPLVLQGIVLLIAVGLIVLGHKAAARSWWA